MNIELIPIKDFVFNGEGTRLVRTESHVSVKVRVNYLPAIVKENGKVEVNNQIVTHISKDIIS